MYVRKHIYYSFIFLKSFTFLSYMSMFLVYIKCLLKRLVLLTLLSVDFRNDYFKIVSLLFVKLSVILYVLYKKYVNYISIYIVKTVKSFKGQRLAVISNALNA